MPPEPDLIPLASLPLERLLALNNAHALETSHLERDQLARHIAHAAFAQGVAPARAFLLAFDQQADLTTPNFHWFRQRYPTFLYVDRVIVAGDARGLGLARRLYGALEAFAMASGHHLITCEVNAEPPNPASDALHASLGFMPVGSAHLGDRGKTVTYLAKVLS